LVTRKHQSALFMLHACVLKSIPGDHMNPRGLACYSPSTVLIFNSDWESTGCWRTLLQTASRCYLDKSTNISPGESIKIHHHQPTKVLSIYYWGRLAHHHQVQRRAYKSVSRATCILLDIKYRPVIKCSVKTTHNYWHLTNI